MAKRQRTLPPVAPVAYTTADARAAIGIGKTKLFELLSEGKLRRVRIGRRLLIPASDVRALIEENAA